MQQYGPQIPQIGSLTALAAHLRNNALQAIQAAQLAVKRAPAAVIEGFTAPVQGLSSLPGRLRAPSVVANINADVVGQGFTQVQSDLRSEGRQFYSAVQQGRLPGGIVQIKKPGNPIDLEKFPRLKL